ncbi:MAG: hypothetical protein V4436_00270 [Patescibacteria group bacterium]
MSGKLLLHTVQTGFYVGLPREKMRATIGEFQELGRDYNKTGELGHLVIKPTRSKKHIGMHQIGFFVDEAPFENFRTSPTHAALKTKLSGEADWQDANSHMTLPELDALIENLQRMRAHLAK